jgi:sulfatase modifying factor 1
MVRVGNVCIDSTPVTNGQYRAFLADTAKPAFSGAVCEQSAPTDIASPVADCNILDVQRTEVFTNPMMPAVCVTVCDARAFCEWAGRHLCGGLDGKPLPDPEAIGPQDDEWTHACTENDAHDFSTGTTWNSSGCVVKENSPPYRSPQPVDREPRCEGPPGVFDMIGNVVVWIDACDSKCRLAGETSDWRSDESIELGNSNAPGRCDAIDAAEPDYRATDVGFRCCATPK